MQNIGNEVFMYMAGVIGLFLVFRCMQKPFKLIFRLLISSALGGLMLILLNTFGAAWGLTLAVNPVTALISGMLGVPGVAALLFIKLWL